MKEKNLQPRLLYPARISFRYEGEINSFTDKQKLGEFSTTKPALQQMQRDFLEIGNTENLYKFEPKANSRSYLSLINLNINGLNAPT